MLAVYDLPGHPCNKSFSFQRAVAPSTGRNKGLRSCFPCHMMGFNRRW